MGLFPFFFREQLRSPLRSQPHSQVHHFDGGGSTSLRPSVSATRAATFLPNFVDFVDVLTILDRGRETKRLPLLWMFKVQRATHQAVFQAMEDSIT